MSWREDHAKQQLRREVEHCYIQRKRQLQEEAFLREERIREAALDLAAEFERHREARVVVNANRGALGEA